MSTKHLTFFSVPGLRTGDIDKTATPTLYEWANQGGIAELTPTFPCVTSCVQAGMMTGTPPRAHGVIANGFYSRERDAVEFWVGRNDVIAGEQIWDALRKRRLTSAVWHVQNIKGAVADFIVTPAPIHEPDGTTKLWCYSKPDGLYQQLLDTFGHFPLQHYWGPLSNIESTKWILKAAAWLVKTHAPNFHWIYVPHLDYASQKFGPNNPQARNALKELDEALADFMRQIGDTPTAKDVVYLVAGEYAMTDVTGAVHPNRILRQSGLLATREERGREHIDLSRSAAFAMVDHQFAHVFVRNADARVCERVRDLFRNQPGVARAYVGAERAEIDMEHPRSGEVVLVATDDRWFSYYWWLDDAAAPPFARTVDIHNKPGYDPVELCFDPATKGIPLNAGLVKGSHGVPATTPRHRTALICSRRDAGVQSAQPYKDTDVSGLCLNVLR